MVKDRIRHREAAGISLINRVVADEPVEIDPAAVADGVARQEPPGARRRTAGAPAGSPPPPRPPGSPTAPRTPPGPGPAPPAPTPPSPCTAGGVRHPPSSRTGTPAGPRRRRRPRSSRTSYSAWESSCRRGRGCPGGRPAPGKRCPGGRTGTRRARGRRLRGRRTLRQMKKLLSYGAGLVSNCATLVHFSNSNCPSLLK